LLSEIFFKDWNGEAFGRDVTDDLEAVLAEALVRVVARFPQISIDRNSFVSFVAERVEFDAKVLASLQRLQFEDLFLVWGISVEDSEALRLLEAEYWESADGALRRIPDTADCVDEVKQRVRERLFTARDDGAPKILQYQGRGPLKSWLRVVAVRAALDLLKQDKKHVPLTDGILSVGLSEEDNQELRLLKVTYRNEFKLAFQSALASLTDKERNILRYHYIECLNLDAIGEIYKVHRSSVHRWVVSIREALLQATTRGLTAKLGVETLEVESIMRLIQSQLDMSIERFLE
jgi:RNA polymerase sigma-70 factor, ECF subfamily